MPPFPLSFYLFFAAVLFGAVVDPIRKRRSLSLIIIQLCCGIAVLAAGLIFSSWDLSRLLFHILFFTGTGAVTFLLFLKPVVTLPPVVLFLALLITLYSPLFLKTEGLTTSSVKVPVMASGNGVLLRLESPDQGLRETAIFSGEQIYFICGRIHYEPWLFFKQQQPWFFCGYSSRVIDPVDHEITDNDRGWDPGFSHFIARDIADRPGIRLEYRFLGPFPAQENYSYTVKLTPGADPSVLEK